MILVAELSTNHGGDLSIAKDLISAAADAGCDFAKVQTYDLARLNPADPQADWLRQAHLDRAAHETLMAHCESRRIKFLSTPFDAGSLQMLRDLGLRTFKIASSESGSDWWTTSDDESWFVSWPWGRIALRGGRGKHQIDLTAIPLYPTPLEAVGRATLFDGWSDHCVGIDACLWAIAQGVQVLEAHITLGGSRGRCMPWDKVPGDFTKLRRFADACETMRCGVAQRFRERWSA
jgi:N,N'-diacetyllegionaminate synthase